MRGSNRSETGYGFSIWAPQTGPSSTAPASAVADGMGGAQAGEVASRLAAAAFREFHEADELDPAERVAAIIQEANRRIYERARSDAQASGMGTTITAALVSGGSVAIGHVGDSRAYRLRGSR